MAAGAAGSPPALDFPTIASLISGLAPGRALPTVTLVGEAEEDQEVKILVFLVRCRGSGFMGILPRAEMVSQLLESLVDEDSGEPLVIFQTVTVAVLDSSGRKFGNADVFLADFSASCSRHFRRGPALRSAASGGLFRLRVGDAVARPAPRAAWEASEAWIRDVAEDDEHIMEYVTAASDEVQPVADGDRSVEEDQVQMVAQLQARIMELESQMKTPQASPAAKARLQFEPTPRVMQPSVLFGVDGGSTGRVDASTLSKLQDLAGPAPGRLTKLEAKSKARAMGSSAQNAQAEADAGVIAEEELAALTMSGGDPLQRILALQLQQTAALTQRLLPKNPMDAITGALGSESGSSSSNGVRGCVAREAYLRGLEDIGGVGKIIMMNAAADLGLAESQIGGGLMRQYIERRVPLGDHRLLTFLGQYLACAWEIAFNHHNELAMGLFARGLMMIEQIAIDKGRCQFGWLLAGMVDPDLAQISVHKQRSGIKPYAKLAAAPWIAGNIAYLKDLDYLETRLKTAGDTTIKAGEDPKEDADPKIWRKKKKGKAKEDSADTTAS